LRQTLIFWLFKPFNFKRRVSSQFVAKTTTCCICMWKLSFSKSGNTHLISETLNIQGWLDVGSSESKAKGSFGQKEFYFSNMGEIALDCLKKSPEEH
jgi:hypothetical protein